MYPWLVEMYYIHADKKACNFWDAGNLGHSMRHAGLR